MSKKTSLPCISGRAITMGMLAAVGIGLAVGSFRYWFGYFILGQALVAGFTIPWLMGKLQFGAKETGTRETPIFGFIFFLLFCFMLAQAVGFGLSQPWFYPTEWMSRVFYGLTSEFIFGVGMHGGVENKAFAMGAQGWFWIFANLFDLAFMYFFLTVGVNIYFEKAEKQNA